MFRFIFLILIYLSLHASNLPILETGQTHIYQNGDNGTFTAGKKRSYSRAEEIVTDHATGLMWQDDSDAKIKKLTWKKANSYCQNLPLGEYSDWRLPRLKELKSIVDYSKMKPAIGKKFENVVPGYYWSSTTDVVDPSLVWAVDFKYGNDDWDSRTSSFYVRCVRGQ